MNESRNKTFIYFGTALIIISGYYLYLISVYPYFLTDDYLNFGIINLNYSNFISFNLPAVSTYERFYFYTRPITYLISIIDLKVFSENSFLMKIFSIILNSVLIYSLYLYLLELAVFLKKEIKGVAVLIALVFFSLHPNNMWWIYWISNQNEMLMIGFYVIALWCILKYLNTTEIKFLNFYLVFYFLSILTKQQPLHLPVLVIAAIYFNRTKISSDKFLSLRKYSIIGFLLMIFYTIFTFLNSTNSFKAEYFLKKPFSLAGNLLYVIFPLNSLSNYEYFVAHKEIAIILFFIFSLLILYMIIRKKIKVKTTLFIFSIVIISFYPRLIDGANNRINTIQVLFLMTSLFLFLTYRPDLKKYIITTWSILILLNCFETAYLTKYYNSLREIQQVQAKEYIKDENKNKVSAISFWSHLLPYQVFFLKNNAFGKEDLNSIPLSYSILNEGKSYSNNIKVNCILKNDNLDIRTVEDPDVRIDIDNFNPKSKAIKYLQDDINYEKGFKELTLPLDSNLKKVKLIYFDGIKWARIN